MLDFIWEFYCFCKHFKQFKKYQLRPFDFLCFLLFSIYGKIYVTDRCIRTVVQKTNSINSLPNRQYFTNLNI